MTLPETAPETISETSTARFLEIHVFFASGEIARFAQDDPQVVHALLQHLPSPSRLFTQPHLTITGDQSLSLIPTAAVTRLDIRTTAALPAWPFLGGADSVQDVPEAVYRERFDPEAYAAARRDAAIQPGTRQSGFTEIEMNGGRRLFWEVQMQSRPLLDIDIARLGNSLLHADGLHARLPQDSEANATGVMVINPAHIQCLTFFPGPPQASPNAWNLHRV